MSTVTVTQWPCIIVALLLIATLCRVGDCKVFERCELAKSLRQRHRLDLGEVANWVCIAQHSSGFNTAAQAFSATGGSHGIFQISDVYWCSPPGKGAGCNLPCHKLRDDNLSDDFSCAKRIYDEHQRISGDGYTAWNAYQQFCRDNAFSYIKDCFPGETKTSTFATSATKAYNSYQSQYSVNAIADYSTKKRGKLYGRCELAQELYHKHKMPMEQIPTWVCIAEHESRFDTAAVGRLNADGSADHGLFQISDLYWCSHDHYSGGKACGLSCSKLLDEDITDDVRCIKKIHNEHTAISGDGFNAWTVYRPYCQNQRYEQIANCFKNTQSIHHQHKAQTNLNSINNNNPFLKNTVQHSPTKSHHTSSTYNDIFKASSTTISASSRDISTWVCIAEYESQFNTAAIGRLNTDGSADHGLFQISDKYWCTHDAYGGKACNLSCDKLLDDDLMDDVQCIRTIHEEHTRISGDGFNAWTVYRPHCQNRNIDYIEPCFDKKTLESNEVLKPKPSNDVSVSKGKGKIYSKCELAQELYHKHRMPMDQIPKWVCIAKYESSFNTAAVGRLNTDGSADHGLFQISDLYWCTHNRSGGKACNIACDKLLDSDITDDVQCIKIIHEEHTRISGDGFNAWTVYQPHCHNSDINYVKDCFTQQELKQSSNSNSLVPHSTTSSKTSKKGKIYKKCELAQELFNKHRVPMEQIPKWVCIAQHESSYNTAAVGRFNTDGSADHGLFQISDLYWCTHDQNGGKACDIPCDKLLDSDITDDVKCINIIYEEHTRISGDGFNAWTVYKPHCRHTGIDHIKDCFTEQELQQAHKKIPSSSSSSITPHSSTGSKSLPKGKVYKKCELAQELYHKHRMPMEQIPKWVCIAQHESSYNTAAVGRLNTDGSADHGLFQISDLYWCAHDQQGGSKACNIPCDKLLDSDITDDVKCIKIIYEEHTRISGDGFNAWTVYKPHCRNIGINHVENCFTEHELKDYNKKKNAVIESSIRPDYTIETKNIPKGKIYNKCELAKELLTKHKMPMEQIPTWVCIAQHESSFNTAAIGRLNADGSADHGLFQISDLYWCAHDEYGGKACNIPCDKLLDSDITDDVRCIKIIYEEHTRISGDGFNAWTVYKPHCRNRKMEEIRSCFSPNQIEQFDKQIISYKITNNRPSDSSYSHNPFLLGVNAHTSNKPNQKQSNKQDSKFNVNIDKPNYANNPFLQNIKTSAGSKEQNAALKATNNLNAVIKQDYRQNPFLNGSLKSSETTLQNYKQKESNSNHSYHQNPFLSGAFTSSTKEAIISNPTELRDTEAYKPNPTVNLFNSFNKTETTIHKYENKYVNSNDFRTTTLKPTTQSATKYINSNDFRITTTLKPITKTETRTTTQKPNTSWNAYATTTQKPIAITSDKTTITTTKPIFTATSNTYSATTTKKPNTTTTIRTTTTTVTRKPSTTPTVKRPNTEFKTTTKMPLIITPSASFTKTATTWNWRTTTVSPTKTIATNKWNLQNQKYTSNAATPQTSSHLNNYKLATTTSKAELTTWNWKRDEKLKTTTKPLLTQKPTTTGVSWQKYVTTTTNTTATKTASTTTTAKPSTKTTTTRKPTTTTTNWHKYDKTTTIKNTASTTTTAKPYTKTTTTRKPTTTTTNWHKYDKTTTIKNTASTTTTAKPYTKTITTRKPTTTTTIWQKYDKTTTIKNTGSTTTTRKPSTTIASWQKYDKTKTNKNNASTTTTAKPSAKTTTTIKPTKTTTSWQKYYKTTTKTVPKQTVPSTTTPNSSMKSTTTRKPITTSWQKYDKTTTKATPKKTTSTTTTIKPSTIVKLTTTISSWNKYDKTTIKSITNKPNITTTTAKPLTKSTFSSWTTKAKPTSSTTKGQNNEKSIIKAPSSTITTPKSTFKPNTVKTTKSSITTTTKKPTITIKTYNNYPQFNENIKTTTSIPRTAPTTLKNTATTTKQKPSTTASQSVTDYDKYKKDPFSHPFFSKVNEQLKQLRDAPVILTLPHMLGASNEYTKMIRGLNPDTAKHQTFVDVQHLTGVPLQGGKRVQFNMFLKSINRITITENLTTVLMPAIWVEEGIELNSEMVTFFKKRLINTLKTLNVVHWAALCGGIGVAALCLIYYVVQRRKPTAVVEAPLK
ncbi:hypothetical protein DOY81_003158 [Sarcophaga bullata]|nr:hypothetical protein DOY81_003158 [Sarcophaga bullata]